LRVVGGLPLDICAAIWLAEGDPVAPEVLARIDHIARRQACLISFVWT